MVPGTVGEYERAELYHLPKALLLLPPPIQKKKQVGDT